LFPPAQRDLTLRFTERGLALHDVVAELGAATGVHFVLTDDTNELLKASPSGLQRELQVPAASAWVVVEGLLARKGLLFVPSIHREPCLVTVTSAQDPGRGFATDLKTHAVPVDAADLPSVAEHSAVLVTTVLDVEPMDARQLSTSLRQLMPDQTTMSILPLNEASLLVVGPAHTVAALARLLAGAAERERERTAERSDPKPKTASMTP
jgi:hypothetical protein